MTDTLSLLNDLIKQALTAGADSADALLVDSASLSIGRRMRKPERLERSELVDFGLRVFVGKKQATVSSTDLKPETLSALVDKAMQVARVVPEDEFSGIADAGQVAHDWPELDLFDPTEPSAEFLIERASAMEEAALAVPGITNSSGADASWGRSVVTLVASNGFAGQYQRSSHSLSVSVVAEKDGDKQVDYDFTNGVFLGDLDAPEAIGKSAGDRTIAKLNPRKIESMRVPIILDPRVAGGLLGSLAGAISGASIARGISFLKDSLGERIFPAGISVIDDPYVLRGHRSKPFDGEGVAPMQRPIINDGYLTTWLLDLRSARQLGLVSTGHAARGTGGPPAPSPTNVYLTGGTTSRDDLLKSVNRGLYVTGLMGQGANMTTGDYSRGATGFWIENGVLTHPVAEITIAGNMKEMFKNITAATDLVHRYGIDAPTLRIDGMTIAGL